MTASSQLLHLTLPNNWFVFRNIQRTPSSTGGTFSHSYLARQGERVAFIKAFDFSDAFSPGAQTLQVLNNLIASYEHERRILEHCKTKRLRNVALAIDHGEVSIPDMSAMEGRVFYLIFENALSDLRVQIDDAEALDAHWCLRALGHTSLGLWQLHRQLIAHQDIKPSNILLYSNDTFRVADLGRSSQQGHQIAHDEHPIPGDRTYAPPELLYGYTHPDFKIRRFGTDLYMLGNFAAFLFSGANITELLLTHLEDQYHWRRWNSQYSQVLPYVQEAFVRVMEKLSETFPPQIRGELLSVVSQLCEPDLAKRGHPRGVGNSDPYSLERYVSLFDLLTRRLALRSVRVLRTA